MAKKKYNILKAASWYTVGNILINGVGFFVLPVFTRLMNTEEYGIYSVYTSYLSIISTIVLLGLASTVSIAKFAREVDFESYMSTIIVVPIVVVVICQVIINVLILVFGNILSMGMELWNCLFITATSNAICLIIASRLIIEGRYILYMSYSAINTVASVAISLVLCYTVYKSHDVHLARVYGGTIANLIGVAFLLISTKTKVSVKRINLKYALMWGIPLMFHTVATVILMQSDRILIRYMDSYSSAGIYAIATTLVSIPLVLQQSFGQAWTPWFYGKLDVKDYKQIRWLNNRYIVLYGVIIACFMIVAPELVHLFTEQSYWGCIYSLVPLAISVFAELLYSIPTSVESYNKKTNYIMTATLITVAINIVLDVLFILAFGYHGAAYATVLSKIVLFLIHYLFSRKFDSNKMFSDKIVIISLILLLIIDVSVLLMIDLIIIRYIVLTLILIPAGIYVYKNKNLLMTQLLEK